MYYIYILHQYTTPTIIYVFTTSVYCINLVYKSKDEVNRKNIYYNSIIFLFITYTTIIYIPMVIYNSHYMYNANIKFKINTHKLCISYLPSSNSSFLRRMISLSLCPCLGSNVIIFLIFGRSVL